MTWSGADTGRTVLTARAERCEPAELRVYAGVGDTGVLILIRGNGTSVAPGQYPVLPLGDFRQVRPAAAVVSRWIDSLAVIGARSRKGTLSLTTAGASASGSFETVTQQEASGRLDTLRGSFRNVPVGPCRDSVR